MKLVSYGSRALSLSLKKVRTFFQSFVYIFTVRFSFFDVRACLFLFAMQCNIYVNGSSHKNSSFEEKGGRKKKCKRNEEKRDGSQRDYNIKVIPDRNI